MVAGSPPQAPGSVVTRCGEGHQAGLDQFCFLEAGVALDPHSAEGVGGQGEVAGAVGAAFLEVFGQVGGEQQPVGVEVLGHLGEAAVQVGGVVGVVVDQVQQRGRDLAAVVPICRQGADSAADHPGLGQGDLTGRECGPDLGELGGVLGDADQGSPGAFAATGDVGEEVLGRGPAERLGATGLLEAFGEGDQGAVHDCLQPAQRDRGLQQIRTPDCRPVGAGERGSGGVEAGGGGHGSILPNRCSKWNSFGQGISGLGLSMARRLGAPRTSTQPMTAGLVTVAERPPRPTTVSRRRRATAVPPPSVQSPFGRHHPRPVTRRQRTGSRDGRRATSSTNDGEPAAAGDQPYRLPPSKALSAATTHGPSTRPAEDGVS